MTDIPACPACEADYCYQDGNFFICPACGHEWALSDNSTAGDSDAVYDAHGTQLHDGDAVTVIKDLKLKGSSAVIKVGTKVKNIRLVAGDHDIDCKLDGVGAIKLKSQFVKKV